jgi:asparagine synthase (glutamine-hydrolysing)
LSPEAEQPFHSEDGRVHAVVNGELYDHDRIRTALQAKGHVFQSACDSEIVIALYAEYGLGFLSHLRGEFTLCLYDAHSQTFYAAVDRYSIKPLFYTVRKVT